MCDIGGLALAPYLVPVFAGSFLMGISLMCFMRRSYDNGVAKIVARLALLEKQVQESAVQPTAPYYPPVAYSHVAYNVRPSAPL